jgi:hypothetical protein
MKQQLLLCQSQADSDALLPAVPALVSAGVNAIWLLYSPVVLVDTKAAEAEHQRNIDGLNASIARCTAAEDFQGALAYKVQRDAAVLERATAVKDAWKKLAVYEQAEAEKKLFTPFLEGMGAAGISVRVQRLTEHYETPHFIDALNSIRKSWFAPCAPGTFSMDWVSNVAAAEMMIKKDIAQAKATVLYAPTISATPAEIRLAETVKAHKAIVESAALPAAEKLKGNPMHRDPRYKQLMDLNIDQLGELALKLTLKVSGTAGKIRKQIWEHEKTLVETY